MGKELDWVRETPSGSLLYRRRYPQDVKPYVGRGELKVPLGAKWRMTEMASRTYHRACAQFDEDVRLARTAAKLAASDAGKVHHALTPKRIEYLADLFVHERDSAIRFRVMQGRGRLLHEALSGVMEPLRMARLDGNHADLEDVLGPSLDDLLEAEGLRVDPADLEGRKALVWSVSGKLLNHGEDLFKITSGFSPPPPPRPERPRSLRASKRTVSDLVAAYRTAKWESWTESSRMAVAPVFRILEEVLGAREVAAVLREDARDLMATVRRLPASLGRQKALAGLPLLQAIERAQTLNLALIGPGTVNRGYMVHLAAIFNFARKEQWTGANPFEGLSVHDPVEDQDKRDAFTPSQLQQLFTTAPWAAPTAIDTPRPGAYWVPLIALFSGARLAEMAGLRVMDVEELEGVTALRIRPYVGRTMKTAGSRRDVPVHSELIRLGFLKYVVHRRSIAAPADLLFPDGKGNTRGQWGAKLGERFVAHLKELGINGTKLGMHSFRHSFEDRLKAAKLHGTAEGRALAGRQSSGSEASYGGNFLIGDLQQALERVIYPGLELAHLTATAGG